MDHPDFRGPAPKSDSNTMGMIYFTLVVCDPDFARGIPWFETHTIQLTVLNHPEFILNEMELDILQWSRITALLMLLERLLGC